MRSKGPAPPNMAYKTGARRYAVTVDVEDLQLRCTTAMTVAGLTVKDVADYMGVRVDYVKNALQGRKHYMSVDFLISFCAICRCTIADILPFANDVVPFPHTFTVVGGGAVEEISPSPYSIAFSDPEDLGDARWYGKEAAE